FGTEKRPSASVFTTRCALVPALMTVTVAPGIAPLVESTTWPKIPDEADSWARMPTVRSHKATRIMLPSLSVIEPPGETFRERPCMIPRDRSQNIVVGLAIFDDAKRRSLERIAK